LLAEHNIGAVVVAEGDRVAGIVSERDVVRRLSQDPGVLRAPVRDIMTADVLTCELGQKVDNVMVTMTTKRVRHMPVVDDGRLVGIISIGDVVKSRIDSLEFEKEQLTNYLAR
jgi:CBS domain-containing protein